MTEDELLRDRERVIWWIEGAIVYCIANVKDNSIVFVFMMHWSLFYFYEYLIIANYHA